MRELVVRRRGEGVKEDWMKGRRTEQCSLFTDLRQPVSALL